MPINSLTPFNSKTGNVNVVIDTPKGSRNKYSWDEKLEMFILKGVLAAGHVFPYDFGFIPGTRGGDGDPLDVLVIGDEPTFVGCLIESRLIGAIEAEQTEIDGATMRNDRLIAVASESPTHESIRSFNDLDAKLVDQLEHFFVSYNAAKGKVFTPLGRFAAKKARALVESSIG